MCIVDDYWIGTVDGNWMVEDLEAGRATRVRTHLLSLKGGEARWFEVYTFDGGNLLPISYADVLERCLGGLDRGGNKGCDIRMVRQINVRLTDIIARRGGRIQV